MVLGFTKDGQKAMESVSVVALSAVWQVLVPDISIATHISDLFRDSNRASLLCLLKVAFTVRRNR